MKRRFIILCLLAAYLASVLIGCTNASPLHKVMENYSRIAEGDIPGDIRLTIYYIDPDILTRYPLSVDDLKTLSDVTIISVDSEELASHWTRLKMLNASVLRPVKEGTYINARICYVFETGDSERILEVVFTSIYGNAFVNGIEVENHPVLYELIASFIPADGRALIEK